MREHALVCMGCDDAACKPRWIPDLPPENPEDSSLIVHTSDDQGATWIPGQPFKGPFAWAVPSAGHFIECADGKLALPIYGCVTEDEVYSYSSSTGVVQSTDGGRTWGDFSFVFRTRPKGPNDYQAEPRYSEMDISVLPNGHWVALCRTEFNVMGPTGWGNAQIAVSTDSGRTWRRTGACLVNVGQQRQLVLPDGAIAITRRSHSWQQAGVSLSYDEGRSFAYELAGPYETVNAFRHGDDELVVYTAASTRSDGTAGVYRWIAHPNETDARR